MSYSGYAISDYHVHPNFSIDAEGSIDEHCRAALKAGLKEICFTTHYDNDPEYNSRDRSIVINGQPEPLSDTAIEKYIAALKAADKEYFPIGLAVRVGIEVGYFYGCEEGTARLFNRHQFDYKLVGIHDIDHVCFCSKKEAERCFREYDMDQFADLYFEQAKAAAECGLFDAIAHLDVYRRYGMAHYGEPLLKIHEGRIEPVFEVMARTGTGFEINTAAYRHGLNEFYPTMPIINLARSMGVPVRAIGSDAHRPEQVGQNLDMAAAVAHEIFPYTDE